MRHDSKARRTCICRELQRIINASGLGVPGRRQGFSAITGAFRFSGQAGANLPHLSRFLIAEVIALGAMKLHEVQSRL